MTDWVLIFGILVFAILGLIVPSKFGELCLDDDDKAKDVAFGRIRTLSRDNDLATRTVILEILDVELASPKMRQYSCPALIMLNEHWDKKPEKLQIVIEHHCGGSVVQ